MKKLSTLNTSISVTTSSEMTGIANIANGVLDPSNAKIIMHATNHMTPNQVTKHTASTLESLLNCVIREETNADFAFRNWRFPSGNIFEGDIDTQKKLHKEVVCEMKDLMVCVDEKTIQEWILEVMVCTTSQAKLTEADLALKCRVYAKKLAHIPADILKYACDEICKTSTFFPSLAEFIKYTEKPYDRRLKLVSGIINKILTYSDKNDHQAYLSA